MRREENIFIVQPLNSTEEKCLLNLIFNSIVAANNGILFFYFQNDNIN